ENVKCHIQICKTYKDYRCSICRKKFTTISGLKMHMSNCGKTLYINSKFCPYKTCRSDSLRKHMVRHFKNDPSIVDESQVEGTHNAGPLYDLFCEKCSRPEESGEYKNDCYYCLKCKTKLRLHCRKCNLIYKCRRNITAHHMASHGRQKCLKCDRQFQNLNLHINFCRDPTIYCGLCHTTPTKNII
ncbi:hypothetical protein TSAR_002038, partial [Trichomalopsis sarcophagae]